MDHRQQRAGASPKLDKDGGGRVAGVQGQERFPCRDSEGKAAPSLIKGQGEIVRAE